jgi:isocitrate/isopropylmalate dehydrogenase
VLKIAILLGDDIGLEVVPEAVKVMKAASEKAGLEVERQPLPIGRKTRESQENANASAHTTTTRNREYLATNQTFYLTNSTS